MKKCIAKTEIKSFLRDVIIKEFRVYYYKVTQELKPQILSKNGWVVEIYHPNNTKKSIGWIDMEKFDEWFQKIE